MLDNILVRLLANCSYKYNVYHLNLARYIKKSEIKKINFKLLPGTQYRNRKILKPRYFAIPNTCF